MVALNPKRVLVPTDFSDEATKAVDDGLNLVDNPNQLTVVHVAPQAVPSEEDLVVGWNFESQENREQRLLEMLRAKFPDKKYADVHFQVLFGTPATEIVKFAEKDHADLIMLPSHGRQGLARLMIGSVAERVVRLAHCPVLVLRE
ncbi:MAG: universal stress protein [Bythopirellula sp.]|nr:universal stress protein [Bythopirellula sp.]